MIRARRAVAVAALLVLAGCAAPTQHAASTATPAATTQTPTPTTTTTTSASTGTAATGGVDVRNGTLPVNATRVFRRVRSLTGANVTPPTVVRVVGADAMRMQARALPRFARLMGIRAPGAPDTVTAAGLTRGGDDVALNTGILDDPRTTESVLAHEFAHVVQYETNAIQRTRAGITVGTTDERLTFLGVVEGAAVYVESRYQVRYGNGTPGRVRMARAYRSATAVRKYALAPYHFGSRYVARRVPNASAVDDVYRRPPNGTEALIHGENASLARPSLSVEPRALTWNWADRDRMGELFVRHVLVTELPADRAARAAAGWGMDRHLTVRGVNRSAYVWALRWDTPRDAAEFERALTDYLDARATRDGDLWRDDAAAFAVARVGPETVVLTAGDPGFVENASVTGGNATVTVTD